MGAAGAMLDLPELTSLQLEAAELIPVDKTRIQTQLERQMEQHLAVWRVPKQDRIWKRVLVEDEFLTNPEEIFIQLGIQRPRRPHAGMDAQERSEADVRDESEKKFPMLRRQAFRGG